MMPDAGRSVKPVLLATAAAALTLSPRLWFLPAPVDPDSAAYALVARYGGLYTEIPFDRPQGIFWVFDASLWLFGDSMVAARIGAAIFAAATAFVLVILADEIVGLQSASVTGILFPVLSTTPLIEGFTANAEVWSNLPLVLCAWLAWRGRYGAAGFVAGIASFLKPSGAAGLVLAAGLALTDRQWRGAARACAAFAVMPALSVGLGWLSGWDAYWYSLVTQRLRVHSAATLGLSAQLAHFWWGFLGVVPALAAVLTGTAVALTQRPRRERGFLGWWMLGTIGGGMIGALWWAHYFIQWMPPLVLGTALGLRDLGRLRPALRRTVAGIGLAGVMPFLSDVPQWTRPERIEVRREKGGASAAAFVAARSDPGDSI